MIQQALIFDFSLGELSPKLRGRFDSPVYQHGASLIKNAIPAPQGGFSIRPGTEQLGETNTNAKVRLIPFLISVDLSYVLEFGHVTAAEHGYIRIWKAGALLMTTGPAILEFTTHYSASELPEIQYTQDDTRIVFTHQNRPPACLEFTATDAFTYSDAISFTGNSGEVPFQTSTNYPRACQFHEGRLWFASTQTQPGAIWASKPYEYSNFTFFDTISSTSRQLKDPATWANPLVPEFENVTTTRNIITSANAIEIEIDDTILWLASGRDMIIGTVRGERIVPAGSYPPIVPCVRNTAIGTAEIQPFMLAGAVMMVEANGQQVREYQYQEQQQAYHAPALSFSADHILGEANTYVEEMDFQQNPVPIVWALRHDGVLIGCVYEKAQGIAAWFRFQTTGVIESLAVIPGTTEDALYISVLRGATRYIERVYAHDSSLHLDNSKTVTAAAGKVTAVTWLTGTVSLVYDYQEYAVAVVANEITLPTGLPANATVLIGIPFDMQVTSMPLPAQTQGGTAHMRPKNPAQVRARVLNTRPFKAGNIATQLETAAVVGSYTGDVKIPIRGQWDTEGLVHIIQDNAQDTTILALQIEVDAGG